MRKRYYFFVIAVFSLLCMCSCASIREINRNNITASTATDLESKLEYLGIPEATVSDIEIFYDGKEWSDRLTSLIDESESYVLITSFLASECEENEIVYQALVEKAQSGIPVYFVCDSTSSMDMTESKNHLRPLYYLAEKGVHFLEYNPLSFDRMANPLGLFMREHRKIVVIDGHTVAVGGMNINFISSSPAVAGFGQRDSMYCIESESLAKVMTEDFIHFWNNNSFDEIREEFVMLPSNSEKNLGYKAWVINQTDDNIIMPEVFSSLFYSAEDEILILPFLPLMNKDLLKMVSNASERGVYLELILPNETRPGNNRASHYSVLPLMENGMNIRTEINSEDTTQLLHEKLMIIDNRYILIGSINFNFRSMVLSQEVGILIDSPELAEIVKSHYTELRTRTEECSIEDAMQWRTAPYFFNFILSFITG